MEPRQDHRRFKPSALNPAQQALVNKMPKVGDVPVVSLDDSDDYNLLTARMPPGAPPIQRMTPCALRCAAEAMTNSIFESYNALHKILERHEATIQRRWTKKTRTQKLKILLEAWPDMATMHHPDFQAYRIESPSDRYAGTKFRDCFMWPSINQEDLSKPRTFLLLINSRGRHLPCDFAAVDGNAIELGLVTSALTSVFLGRHAFILNGATKPEEYGKLVAIADDPDAFDMLISRRQFHPGKGLLILEVQQRLLKFLVQCCCKILHDIPFETISSDAFPVLPEPHIKTEVEMEGFDSLPVMAEEAPYRVPEKLDLARISSLLDARASAAEDHLWALREDPSYFADNLSDVKEHRLELLLDIHGKPHPVVTRENSFWACAIGSLVYDAYMQFELFSKLRDQAQELQLLQTKYATKISPQTDLPKEYLRALLMFKHYLNQAVHEPLSRLPNVVASPPMRRFYTRLPSADENVGWAVKPAKTSDTEKRLLWLLPVLWEDGPNLLLFGQTRLIDELQRLLDSDQDAKKLITAYISATIGDLSILAQCLHELELYQPWANRFDQQENESLDGLKKAYATDNAKWAALVDGLYGEALEKNQVVMEGKPIGGRFDYPVGKRRTQQNVEAMRKAEANLDAFWEGIDRIRSRNNHRVRGTAVYNLLAQERALQRTPEWVEPPKVEKKASNATKKAPQINTDLVITKPFSALYFGLPEPTTGPLLPLQIPKNKVKTRGNRTTNTPDIQRNEPEDAAEQEQDTTDTQPALEVDARALKVLRMLFFNPETTSTPGEVAWPDFLHAMASTGFAAQKLYGSVWQFRPMRLDVERGILFHEPHPHGKIPFVIARRHGRRLNRAYGWSDAMFVLKK